MTWDMFKGSFATQAKSDGVFIKKGQIQHKVWKSESNWDQKSQCELEFFDFVIKDLREAFPWLFGSFCLDELTLPQPHIMGLNHIFISIYISVHLATFRRYFTPLLLLRPKRKKGCHNLLGKTFRPPLHKSRQEKTTTLAKKGQV